MIIETKYNIGDDVWVVRTLDYTIRWRIKQIHVVVYESITRIVYEFENGHSQREDKCFGKYEEAEKKANDIKSKYKK